MENYNMHGCTVELLFLRQSSLCQAGGRRFEQSRQTPKDRQQPRAPTQTKINQTPRHRKIERKRDSNRD